MKKELEELHQLQQHVYQLERQLTQLDDQIKRLISEVRSHQKPPKRSKPAVKQGEKPKNLKGYNAPTKRTISSSNSTDQTRINRVNFNAMSFEERAKFLERYAVKKRRSRK